MDKAKVLQTVGELQAVGSRIKEMEYEREIAMRTGNLNTAVLKRKAISVAKGRFRELERPVKGWLKRYGITLSELIKEAQNV